MTFRINHKTGKPFPIKPTKGMSRKVHEALLRAMEEPITGFKGYTTFTNQHLEEIKLEKLKLDNFKVNGDLSFNVGIAKARFGAEVTVRNTSA